jgi:uncharacterized protein YndB with AHSA1/START domain
MTLVVDRIVREITVDVPDWRVWSVLTEPAHLRAWYGVAAADVDFRVGGTVSFTWAEHGTFLGTVEEVDAPHRLAYRLGVVPNELPRVGNSTVTILTIVPDGAQSRIRAEEVGYTTLDGSAEEQAGRAREHDAGWHRAFTALAEHAKTLHD